MEKYLLKGKLISKDANNFFINLTNLTIGSLIYDEEFNILGEVFLSDNEISQAYCYSDKIRQNQTILTYNEENKFRLAPDSLGGIYNIFSKKIYTSSNIFKKKFPTVELTTDIRKIDPHQRLPVTQQLETGIKSIDLLTPIGKGQRLAIIASAGSGKSTLINMIAGNSTADLNIIALVGERGREINELITTKNADFLGKSLVIYSTSDSHPVERIRCVELAIAIAEYLRDQGLNVLLLIDSLSRYLRAHKENSLNQAEPPIYKGYPNSTFNKIATILERVSNGEKGYLTGIFTLLKDSDNDEDPLINEVISVVDGHLYLTKNIISKNIYPAVDYKISLSRLQGLLQNSETAELAKKVKLLLSELNEIEDLLKFGIKLNKKQKQILSQKNKIYSLLRQKTGEKYNMQETIKLALEIV